MEEETAMDVEQNLPGVFRGRRHVYWSHCDPAGIIYEPRFGQWLHDLLERWFEQVVDVPYVDCIQQRRIGFPTKNAASIYHFPARLGDIVEVQLRVERIGRTSITFYYQGWRVDKTTGNTTDLLFESTVVRVVVDLNSMQPQAWPDDLRSAIERFKAAAPAEEVRDAS